METLPIRSRILWDKLKRTDSQKLLAFIIALNITGLAIVVAVIVFWPVSLDSSPLAGLILLGVSSTALLFKRGLKGQVLRVWRYLKK